MVKVASVCRISVVFDGFSARRIWEAVLERGLVPHQGLLFFNGLRP